ncbi:hypothetical protein D1872_184440 [compost metagenome]
MKRKPIYVEAFIRSDTDALWEYTQDPKKHERWDLRFSRIAYMPRPDEASPQRFLYETQIGFGLSIAGEGESVGSHVKETGERTSALKFWTDQPVSLIKKGSGYWKYIPEEGGVRFLTQYDYQTRFGMAGTWFDALIFRPLMGWATAWSFERLRLWLEQGMDPKLSLLRSVIQCIIVWTLAFTWIYQGAVPKLLYKNPEELALLKGTGLVPENGASIVLTGAGMLEILFGLCFFWLWRSKGLFILNIVLLLFLDVGAFLGNSSLFTAPFNPVTLSVLMISFSLVAILNQGSLPDTKRCIRTR